MEELCKEMDEVREQMEKLKVECRSKSELYENLKRVHNQLSEQFQELKRKADRKEQELCALSAELSEANRSNEELRCSMAEKEKVDRELCFMTERLRASLGEKVVTLEREKRELDIALDDATTRTGDLERECNEKNGENERLKREISVSEKKLSEMEQKLESFKELKQKNGMISQMEDELEDVKTKLKWKNEQFNHLELAKRKIQEEFTSSKEKWTTEQLKLVETISSLEDSLDSQVRISEDLQMQLKTCNQALAHEESRRKLLEVQLSESQSQFDNMYASCQEEQLNIENLAAQRDEEIANLRNSLGEKSALLKEMEYKITHLELDNKDLYASLKELQEAQIKNAGSTPSLKKLREKLRNLEKEHSNCSENLKAREAEWNAQTEKMKEDMSSYISELQNKDILIEELQKELDKYQDSSETLIEEMDILVMVIKSSFSEAYLELADSLKGLLDEALLRKKIKSEELMEQERLSMQRNDLEGYNKMLKEAYDTQHVLEERVLHMENAVKDVSDALQTAESELARECHEKSLMETDLQTQKVAAESLKISLEEKLEQHTHRETSFLAELESEKSLRQKKEMSINELRQQIILLQTSIGSKADALDALQLEKNKRIDELVKENVRLEQELIQRELEDGILAEIKAVGRLDHEKEGLSRILEEKEKIIKDLQLKAGFLEEDLISSALSSVSEVTEKQTVIDVLTEALKSGNHLVQYENHNMKRIIAELEGAVCDLQQKLECQKETLEGAVCELQQKIECEKETLWHTKEKKEQLEKKLEAKEKDIRKLRDQFHKEKGSLQCIINELELKNRDLQQNISELSLEKEEIRTHMEQSCKKIEEFCQEDTRLMTTFTKLLMMQGSEKETEMTFGQKLCNSAAATAEMPLTPTRMKIKVSSHERSPLQEIND